MRWWPSSVVLSLLLILAMGTVATERVESVPLMVAPPASLDDLYPPRSPVPILQIGMLEMDRALSALAIDLWEGDLENVQADLDSFTAKYAELAALVPEWQDRYPVAPVGELVAAVASADREAVAAAFPRVGAVCSGCHAATMAPVKFRYHWGDFDDITVKDPVSGEEVDFLQFKRFLDLNFNGIAVDLQQGQTEAATVQLEDFSDRFGALATTCATCHDTERTYYVGAAVAPLLDGLAAALASPQIDGRTVASLMQELGSESCLKCHQVHSPATFVRMQWR